VIVGGITVFVNVQTTVAPVATLIEFPVPGVSGLLLLVQASEGVYAASPPLSET
jgi:hypothetical protein